MIPLFAVVKSIYYVRYGKNWLKKFDKYERRNKNLGFIFKRAIWDLLFNEDLFMKNLSYRLKEKYGNTN